MKYSRYAVEIKVFCNTSDLQLIHRIPIDWSLFSGYYQMFTVRRISLFFSFFSPYSEEV